MPADSNNEIEISPREVQAKIDRGEKFTFIDVREKWEYDTTHIEGSTLIPLRTIPASLASLQTAGEIIFFCHHGMRSLDAAAWLRFQGIEKAKSLSGGIERWSTDVDPRVPRY